MFSNKIPKIFLKMCYFLFLFNIFANFHFLKTKKFNNLNFVVEFYFYFFVSFTAIVKSLLKKSQSFELLGKVQFFSKTICRITLYLVILRSQTSLLDAVIMYHQFSTIQKFKTVTHLSLSFIVTNK